MKVSSHILRLFAVSLSLSLFTACSNSRSEYVLSNGKMEDLLYDFELAKALTEAESSSNRYKGTFYIKASLDKHKVSDAVFDSTISWYSKHPQEMEKVYKAVIKRLQDTKGILDRQVAIAGGNSKLNANGDSVNIWNNTSVYVLSGLPYNNRVAFEFDNADRQFANNDTLRFSAQFSYLSSRAVASSKLNPVMSLSIKYQNDSIISRLYNISGEGRKTMSLYSDTLGRIKQVSGFIYYPPQENTQRLLLIDELTLLRLHAQEKVEEIN